MENMSTIYDALLESQAEDVMNKAITSFALQRLYTEIDIALQKGDRHAFLSLTNKLKLLKR